MRRRETPWVFMAGLLAILLFTTVVGYGEFGGPRTGIGHQYTEIAVLNPTTYNISAAECSANKIIRITGLSQDATMNLPTSPPLGTVCNLVVAATGHSVIVAVSGGTLYGPTGVAKATVTCTDDAGNNPYGCQAHFYKVASVIWSLTSTPYGNWIWP